MGCLRRMGCLVVLLALALGAWLTREHWIRIMPGSSRDSAVAVTEPVWEPLSPAAAARGKRAIDGMSAARGPAFTNLKAAEIASYVFQTAGAALPASSDSAEAAVINDVLYVRAVVPMQAIAGSGALGPLAGLLNDRERVTLGGNFRVIRPGLSEFQLREVKLRDFGVPRAAIPRLVRQISRGARPAGVSEDAVAVPTPASLADVRIANRRVTLYRATAATP